MMNFRMFLTEQAPLAVRSKEANPEHFCSGHRCLWRIVSGRDGRYIGPCKKHPHLNQEKIPKKVEGSHD